MGFDDNGPSTPPYWSQAIVELSARDLVLAKLIAAHAGIALQSRGDAFQTLARSIVGQQISVKAADSVWKKFAALFPDLNARHVALCTALRLRECGLSNQKAAYLNDLAQQFDSGRLSEVPLRELEDEALIAELTKVKGIGRWTAEMLFYLTRPNIFPLDDLGLQRAMRAIQQG